MLYALCHAVLPTVRQAHPLRVNMCGLAAYGGMHTRMVELVLGPAAAAAGSPALSSRAGLAPQAPIQALHS